MAGNQGCLLGLYAICKPALAPSLKYSHSYSIGEVEAAAMGQHGQAQKALLGESLQYFYGKPTAFRAKQESIARLEPGFMVGVHGLCGECINAHARQ